MVNPSVPADTVPLAGTVTVVGFVPSVCVDPAGSVVVSTNIATDPAGTPLIV